jgi:hypothetical protein
MLPQNIEDTKSQNKLSPRQQHFDSVVSAVFVSKIVSHCSALQRKTIDF